MMPRTLKFALLLIALYIQCKSEGNREWTEEEKMTIWASIQNEIDILIAAVSNKDINTYMEKMPEDFIIYDQNGEIITREKQKEYTLRDWSIIVKTLDNKMNIDSIAFNARDSIYVYTFQKWERIMMQRDRITSDTVMTTQKHKELWKKKPEGWICYDVKELGGDIYINGKKYNE